MNSIQIDLSRQKPDLPDQPGVYIFKDSQGEILYVGKAKSLKKRVSSYFSGRSLSSKIESMLKKAKFLEFIITSNEKEALLLESNLIKSKLPRYNVVLRDDKRYPVLRIDLKERFPRISVERRIEKDGALYFGPFHSAGSLRNTLKFINKVFKLRTCKNLPKDKRPCINYQIGRCLAPCKGDISEEEYRKNLENAIMFLEGKSKELIDKLTKDMLDKAEKLEFEKAAQIRDQINAIKKVLEKQQMVSPYSEDMDVIGISQEGDLFQIVLLTIRDGVLIGTRNFLFKEKEESSSSILEAFIKQYYLDSKDIPNSIVIPFEIQEKELISSLIKDHLGKEVKIELADDSRKKELLEMAKRNAEELIKRAKKEETIKENDLERMKNLFCLKRIPHRIEAVDISQLFGSQRVGAIVAFKDGAPDKERYRNFRIKGEDLDDFSMIKEVLRRRIDDGDLPDLFLIDGGRMHLSSALEVIKRLEDAPDVISIAKSRKKGEPDKIYLEGKEEPLILDLHDPILLFLMRIRDEAHRRAIQYHRKLRQKEQIDSILLKIPGLGKKRVKELLTRFKDINEILNASEDEIASISGIGKRLAKNIKEFLLKEVK